MHCELSIVIHKLDFSCNSNTVHVTRQLRVSNPNTIFVPLRRIARGDCHCGVIPWRRVTKKSVTKYVTT